VSLFEPHLKHTLSSPSLYLLQPSAASLGLTAAVFEFIAAAIFAKAKFNTMCNLQSEFELRNTQNMRSQVAKVAE